MGDELHSGKYGTLNPTEALNLYRAAAAQNNRTALYRLGGMYERGEVVEKNLKLASQYYQLSAAQDYAPAESAMAAPCDLGLIGTPDKSKAYLWAALASRQGNVVARERMNALQVQLSTSELVTIQAKVADFIAKYGDPMVSN